MTYTFTMKVDDKTAQFMVKWLVTRQKSGLIKKDLTPEQEAYVFGNLFTSLIRENGGTGY